MYRLSDEVVELAIAKIIKDNPQELDACINAIYRDLEGQHSAEDYHKRHMTPSCGILTVTDLNKAITITKRISGHIKNKVVIEIGAGIGLLAITMASVAKQVYAIESDPAWSWAFIKVLYEFKPPNLTYIFGKAESMIDTLHGDIVVIATRSGFKEMADIGKQLAPTVINIYETAKWGEF